MIQMLFSRKESYLDKNPIESKRLILTTKKLLPDIVFNMGSLEGNPFTFPEVHTLIDGTTVGGHKVSDQEQILDIRKSWETLFKMIRTNTFNVRKETFDKLNYEVAKNEAIFTGKFRDGEARIGGTDYTPPRANELPIIFNKELHVLLNREATVTDIAFDVFLWGCLNQFYYDGSAICCNLKRVA